MSEKTVKAEPQEEFVRREFEEEFFENKANCAGCQKLIPHSGLYYCQKENCGYAVQLKVPILSPSLFYRKEKVFCAVCAFKGLHKKHKNFMMDAEQYAFKVASEEMGARLEEDVKKIFELKDDEPMDFELKKMLGDKKLPELHMTKYLSKARTLSEWHKRLIECNEFIRDFKECRRETKEFVEEQADELLTLWSEASNEMYSNYPPYEELLEAKKREYMEHYRKMGETDPVSEEELHKIAVKLLRSKGRRPPSRRSRSRSRRHAAPPPTIRKMPERTTEQSTAENITENARQSTSEASSSTKSSKIEYLEPIKYKCLEKDGLAGGYYGTGKKVEEGAKSEDSQSTLRELEMEKKEKERLKYEDNRVRCQGFPYRPPRTFQAENPPKFGAGVDSWNNEVSSSAPSVKALQDLDNEVTGEQEEDKKTERTESVGSQETQIEMTIERREKQRLEYEANRMKLQGFTYRSTSGFVCVNPPTFGGAVEPIVFKTHEDLKKEIPQVRGAFGRFRRWGRGSDETSISSSQETLRELQMERRQKKQEEKELKEKQLRFLEMKRKADEDEKRRLDMERLKNVKFPAKKPVDRSVLDETINKLAGQFKRCQWTLPLESAVEQIADNLDSENFCVPDKMFVVEEVQRRCKIKWPRCLN